MICDSHVYYTTHPMHPLMTLRIQDILYMLWHSVSNLLYFFSSCCNSGSCDTIGESYSIEAASSFDSCELSSRLLSASDLLIFHPSLAG